MWAVKRHFNVDSFCSQLQALLVSPFQSHISTTLWAREKFLLVLLDCWILHRRILETWSCSWFRSVSAMESRWSCTFHHLSGFWHWIAPHVGSALDLRAVGCVIVWLSGAVCFTSLSPHTRDQTAGSCSRTSASLSVIQMLFLPAEKYPCRLH